MSGGAIDPLVIICSSVIVIGLIFLFWAAGKLMTRGPQVSDIDLPEEERPENDAELDLPPLEILPERPDEKEPLEVLKPSAPPPPPAPTVLAAPLAPTKEVSEKLASMAQRLTEMQAVLNRQAAAPKPALSVNPSMGQGFSSETVEKLLKIIGNVIQQIDLLQKSLDVPAGGGEAAAATPGAPSPAAGVSPFARAPAAARPATEPPQS